MPIFDYENAVQQGFNRDPSNNDWNVEARNLEVVLEDALGSSEFRLHDGYNVGIFVARSDGYLSVAGDAEIHGGNLLIENRDEQDFAAITIRDTHGSSDDVSIYSVHTDPNGVVSAKKGSLGLAQDGYLWVNSDGAFEWARLIGSGETSDITLYQAYKNDVDGGDATITTDGVDGSVIIAGSESLRVTATGGIDLDTGFDMDGSGPFDVDISGAVSIDSDTASNFTVDGAELTLSTTTSGNVTIAAADDVDVDGDGVDIDATTNGVTITAETDAIMQTNTGFARIDGATGIRLDGNGSHVRPVVDGLDSLGTSSSGWLDGYFRTVGNGATVSLHAVGATGAPNSTSGANIIGTEPQNFDTFGSFMTDTDVQAALEAIDGYFSVVQNNAADLVTLQRAYDNDPDGGDATIITNGTDGNVVIAGSEALQITATGGIDLDTGFDMDGAGPFDVDITGAVSIDTDAASNFTVDSADLTFETETSGDIFIRLPSGAGDLTVDEGAGTNYLQTNTSTRELLLGDASGTIVDVRVLNDLTVENDLTVNGTTTTVNTENLLVEDNKIRLNINAPSGFAGVTGFEAELGSDGYAEFHWDDTDGRWELSIDRNTTPGAQTFRPLAYLADSPGTLDLSDTGTPGYPTPGPNPDAGASVVNTNATNFPYTFGPDMTDDSIQAALEAIDGYFISIAGDINSIGTTTLQQAYDNDVDGGDATITTNATDGNVVIAGTEAFQVTATGGIDLDSDFDQDGATFDSSLTGAFSVSAGAASDLTTTAGTLTLDGAGGVILDGNGADVVPGADNTDSLGDAVTGWTNIYLNNALHGGAVIALSDAGGTTAHNSTAGADLVGTNSLVFSTTFGPDMTEDTVQAALEAIDGYLQEISAGQSTATLQTAYENGNTITTSAAEGDVTIGGTETVNITATGGLNLDTIFDMDGSTFDVDLTGAASIDAVGASNFTTDSGALTLSTTTSGDVVVSAADDVDIDGTDITLDATAGISLDAGAASNFTTTAGILTVDGAGGVVLEGNGSDVIPGTDNTDSLGNSTTGWTDIYLNNGLHGGTVVALSDAGGTTAHNSTAGADLVGTNSAVFDTFGSDMTDDTVQSALEAIDGYLSDLSLENLDTTYKKKIGLDIHGGVTNGNVSTINLGLSYPASGTGRTTWTVPVPADWDGTSDIEVTVVWSPSNTNGGDIEWRLEARVLALTELVTAAPTNDDYTQTANGTADALQSTEDNLTISAASIETTDAIIGISVVRRADAAGDTFTGNAQVHLVHYNYNAQNIV